MDNFEEKLSSVMNNPEMMQKIMTLAQSLGGSQNSSDPEPPPKQEPMPFPNIDMSTLRKLSGFAQRSGIDKNQQSLLHALAPYISSHRVAKLERAMRAAKMASFATTLLGR
jgi:hypothetical protein